MESFVRGDVVVVPFPFSDLSDQRSRPAFVLANLAGPDIILCQITRKAPEDPSYGVSVWTTEIFSSGHCDTQAQCALTRFSPSGERQYGTDLGV